MILNDLLGLDVFDDRGERLGKVLDARFVLGGPGRAAPAGAAAGAGAGAGAGEARLEGLIISPHSRHSYLGYERLDMNSPAIINAILGWLHRGTFYVQWDMVERVTAHELHLRTGYRRFDPRLPPTPEGEGRP